MSFNFPLTLYILSLSNQMYKATITLCLTLLLSLNHLQTLNLSLLVSSSIEGNIRLDASYAMPINLILSFIFARAFKFVLWFPKLFIPAHYVKTHSCSIQVSQYTLDSYFKRLRTITIIIILDLLKISFNIYSFIKYILSYNTLLKQYKLNGVSNQTHD